MAFAGLRGSGDFPTDMKPRDFREAILMRNPNGSAPIFALTARAGKRVVVAPEFSWWGEANDLIRLQVNGSHAAGDTLINVDSGDPSSASSLNFFGEATNLKEGDLLLVEPAADAATYDQEVVEVTQIVSATQFTVKRGAAGTTAASIANDRWMMLIGSAYAEGTGVPRATYRNPYQDTNYTQIFKDTYELSGTVDASKVQFGPEPWSADKRRKSFQHAMAIEQAILFGRKHIGVGDNGKPKRYMGGLRQQIPAARTTVFGVAVTRKTLFAALEPVFDFDTGAGDERIIFTGNGALTELQEILSGASGTTIQLVPNGQKTYGITFNRLMLPMGNFAIKTHPLLNRHPIYRYAMFVMDFSSLKYVNLRNRDTKSKDDVQAKDEDLRRGFFQTECSIEVQNGGLTMAYIGNVKAT